MQPNLRLATSNNAAKLRDDEYASLLAACARGDDTALKRLYEATSPATYGRLLRLLRDPALASDALQDVYLSVWRNAARFERGRGSVAAWIGTIARNRALDIIQTRRREVPIEAAGDLDDWFEPQAGPEQELATMQEAAALRRCMEQLDSDGRAALQRAYFDGLSYAEVAVWANRPLGTMKSLIRRSLAALKRCLEP